MCNRTARALCLFVFYRWVACVLDQLWSFKDKSSFSYDRSAKGTDRRLALLRSRRSFSSRSFSYVYEARNTSDTHQYAIKKMSCHTDDEEKRARDEVANYQRFSYPNLGVKILKTTQARSLLVISLVTLSRARSTSSICAHHKYCLACLSVLQSNARWNERRKWRLLLEWIIARCSE